MEAALVPSLYRVNSHTSRLEVQPTTSSQRHSRALDEEEKIGGGNEEDAGTAVVANDQGAEEVLPTTFPEGGLQAWLCVFGSFFLLLASFGIMNSVGVLQDYWRENQLKDYPARDIGWISSVFIYLGIGLAIWVGPLFDRYGPRVLTIVGSCFNIISIFTLAECKEYWHFMLCFGILGGTSVGMISTAGLAAISHWFDKRRGRAIGVTMMGSSVGGTLIPLILRAVFPRYGWAWSIRILGFTMLVILIVGNAFVKGRLTPSKKPRMPHDGTPEQKKKTSPMSLHLFADARFSFLAVTVFGIELVLFGVLGVLPTYASIQGYPAETGFYLIAVANGVSCLGRFLPGLICDYVGRFNMLLATIALTLVVMLTTWLPLGGTNIAALYAFAALFGFGTGSWMSLVPVCIGQLCRAEEFGKYFGTCYFVASLAALVCIPIGGELVESVGPQPLVAFFSAVSLLTLAAFVLSRWACLGWKWRWAVKI